jgi:hypothetical protein
MEAGGLSDEQLHTLRRVLRNYGRVRFPALQAELDDLVAQAVSDLWEFLSLRHAAPPGGVASDDVWRLAYTLFRRRAADAYRKGAQRWALGMDSLDGLAEADQSDPADARQRQALLYRRMLRICVAELAQLEPQDRWLLAGMIGLEDKPRGPMAARDRQRLHRLRRRLADAVRRELGEDAQRLLREDI